MADAAVDSVLHAHSIVGEAQPRARGSVTGDEAHGRNVILADSPPAELADCPGIFLATNAFHNFWAAFAKRYIKHATTGITPAIECRGHSRKLGLFFISNCRDGFPLPATTRAISSCPARNPDP